jgi:DNA-directed RNA polymerase subunit D
MVIKLEKIKEERKANKISFLVKGSDEVFVNTIRRMIIEEVPTLAVEDVEIKENNSALYDEMVALRLGLTPIKTDLSSYRLPKNEAEVEERSAQCTLQIKLKVSRKGYVYAGDAESSDPKCTFVYPEMPITKLLAKQKVDIIMTAVMGQGKIHTKWSPGVAFYHHEPQLIIGKVKDPQLIVDQSSDGVFSLKAGKLTVAQDKVNSSQLLEFYQDLDKEIKLEHTDNIIFNVEGWGQLSCKEMVQQSVAALIAKAEEMETLL